MLNSNDIYDGVPISTAPAYKAKDKRKNKKKNIKNAKKKDKAKIITTCAVCTKLEGMKYDNDNDGIYNTSNKPDVQENERYTIPSYTSDDDGDQQHTIQPFVDIEPNEYGDLDDSAQTALGVCDETVSTTCEPLTNLRTPQRRSCSVKSCLLSCILALACTCIVVLHIDTFAGMTSNMNIDLIHIDMFNISLSPSPEAEEPESKNVVHPTSVFDRRDVISKKIAMRVIPAFTSSTYAWWLSKLNSILKIAPVRDHSPNMILNPSLDLGECWAMSGRTGHLGLEFDAPVTISEVAVWHPTDKTEDVSSAPSELEVWGQKTDPLCRAKICRLEYITTLMYNYLAQPVQYFKVPGSMQRSEYSAILVKIKGLNNPKFTCLYGLEFFTTITEHSRK